MLYTTAPAIAVFARMNLLEQVPNQTYAQVQEDEAWFTTWEDSGLIAWRDRNDDGIIQYAPGKAFVGKPDFATEPPLRGLYRTRENRCPRAQAPARVWSHQPRPQERLSGTSGEPGPAIWWVT